MLKIVKTHYLFWQMIRCSAGQLLHPQMALLIYSPPSKLAWYSCRSFAGHQWVLAQWLKIAALKDHQLRYEPTQPYNQQCKLLCELRFIEKQYINSVEIFTGGPSEVKQVEEGCPDGALFMKFKAIQSICWPLSLGLECVLMSQILLLFNWSKIAV